MQSCRLQSRQTLLRNPREGRKACVCIDDVAHKCQRKEGRRRRIRPFGEHGSVGERNEQQGRRNATVDQSNQEGDPGGTEAPAPNDLVDEDLAQFGIWGGPSKSTGQPFSQHK